MSQRSSLLPALFLILFFPSAPAAEHSALGLAADAASTPLADALAAELSSQGVARILARGSLDGILRERGLAAAQGAPPGTPLVAADALLRLETDAAMTPPTIRARLTAVGSGVILWEDAMSVPRDDAQTLALARLLADQLRAELPRTVLSAGDFRLVSFPALASVNVDARANRPGDADDARRRAALDALVRERLQRHPSLVFAERLRLDEVVLEGLGRATPPALTPASVVVEGRVDEFVGGPDGPVRVQFTVGGQSREWTHRRDAALGALANEIAAWIASAAGADPATLPAPEDERARLLDRGRWAAAALLHETALTALRMHDFLGGATDESRELQLRAGAHYLDDVYPDTAAEFDRALALANAHLAFVNAELPHLGRLGHPGERLRNLVASLRAIRDFVHPPSDVQPLSEGQRAALRTLTRQGERLATAFLTPTWDAANAAAYPVHGWEHRVVMSPDAQTVRAVYRAALDAGVFINSPGELALDAVSLAHFQLDLAGEDRPPAQRRDLLEAVCLRAPDADVRRKGFDALARLLEQNPTVLLAAPGDLTTISLLLRTADRHPELRPLASSLAPLTADMLPRLKEPLRSFTGDTWERLADTPEHAQRLLVALAASRAQWEKSPHRHAADHLSYVDRATAAIAAKHPTLAPAAPIAATPGLRPAWFWSLNAVLGEKKLGRGWLRGLTFHRDAFWTTNGCCLFRIALDGSWEHLQGPFQHGAGGESTERFFGVAVNDKFIVMACDGENGGNEYHVFDRADSTWRVIPSPFRDAMGSGQGRFSSLVLHDNVVYRALKLRQAGSTLIAAVEALDLRTGRLRYPVRGDREPKESPMDLPGNSFRLASVEPGGVLTILGTRTPPAALAYAHAWNPTTDEWRQLTRDEWSLRNSDPLRAWLFAGTDPAAFADLSRFRNVAQRRSAAEPPQIGFRVEGQKQPMQIPLELALQPAEITAWEKGVAIQRACNPDYADPLAKQTDGRIVEGQLFAPGLVVVPGGDQGFFFIPREALVGAAERQISAPR